MEHHHPTGEVRRGMSEKLRILIVDDDTTFLEDISFMLRDRYELGFAKSGAEALAAFRSVSWDAVLLDIDLGRGIDGFGVLDAMHAEEPDLPVFMVTRDTSSASAATAFKKGAVDYIDKRPDLADLERKITRALRERILERIARELSAGAGRAQGGMIGKSGPMAALRRAIAAAARSKGPVLVTGETGTGKELVAREFHRLAAPGKPFVAVNCAAFTKELIGSELFGHEKGAFTDAKSQKIGLLELANKGTLFLDEIGEMSLTIQVKLLRVLERMTFRRVGGTKDIKVSVRIISATNSDLEAAVRNKIFREDLYYRLKVVPIFIPPLRERKEDIYLLLKHFLNHFDKQFNKGFQDVEEAAYEVILNYAWPGNIRELKNMVERIVLLENDTVMRLVHIPLGIRQGAAPPQELAAVRRLEMALSRPFTDEGADFEELMGVIERELIDKAMREADGNQSRAARLLRLNRDKIRYRLKNPAAPEE